MTLLIMALIVAMTLNKNKQTQKNEDNLLLKILPLLQNEDLKKILSNIDFKQFESLTKDFDLSKILPLVINYLPKLIELLSLFKTNTTTSTSQNRPQEQKEPLSPIQEIADKNIKNSLSNYFENIPR